MQERRNSIADALELCLPYTNPTIYGDQIHNIEIIRTYVIFR